MESGEFLREFALLIAVFVPLDLYVQNNSLPVLQSAAALIVSVVFWSIGVTLDVVASDE